MKRLLTLVGLCVVSATCGSTSSPTTPTQSATTTTRVINVNPPTLAFGNVPIGQEAVLSITITNTGNAALTVNSGTFTNSVFSSNISSLIIPPGGSSSLQISFKPIAATSYSATLTVNGDQTGGTNTVGLSGTGTAPAVAALYSVFGTVTDGTSHGILPNITVQIVSGANAGRFDVTDATGNYMISGLSAGTFILSAAATSYVTTTQQVTVPPSQRVDLVLQRVAAPSPTPPPTPVPPTPVPPTPGPIAAPGLPSQTGGVCSINAIVHPASCINNMFGNATFICDDGARSCAATSQGACSSHGGIYCAVR